MTELEEFLRNRAALDFYERHFPLVGFHPMSVQKEFIATKAKVAVMSGGNRSGKTEAGAFKAAALANGVLGHFVPGFPKDGEPTRGWVSTLDYKLAEVVKRKLERFLGVTARKWYQQQQMFVLHNGSRIYIKSEESGEQKYQAEDVHWAWKDEAGDWKAQGIYGEILRALTDHDGTLFMTMTPTLGTSWVGPHLYEPWAKEAKDENGKVVDGTTFFFANTVDNIHLSRSGLKAFVFQQVTDEQKAVRLHGKFVALEGLVYSMFRDQKHWIPPFAIPEKWFRYRGMDFGLDAPSVCLFAAVEPANEKDANGAYIPCPCPPHLRPHDKARLHIYKEVYDDRRGHTIAKTCEWIRQESLGQTFVRTVLDPSCWNEMGAPEAIGGHFVVAHEYERCGVYPEKADNKVEPSVERLWSWLGAEADPPQLVLHETCPRLRAELKGQRWKRMAGSLLSTSMPNGLGDKIDQNCPDHAIDALRYIAMCDPVGGGFPMLGPDKDPYPYKELDMAALDDRDAESDPYEVHYH